MSGNPGVPTPLGSIGRGDDFASGRPARRFAARLEVASRDGNLDGTIRGWECTFRHNIGSEALCGSARRSQAESVESNDPKAKGDGKNRYIGWGCLHFGLGTMSSGLQVK